MVPQHGGFVFLLFCTLEILLRVILTVLNTIVCSFHSDKLRHLQEELESERNRRDSQRHGGLTGKSKGNGEPWHLDVGVLDYYWFCCSLVDYFVLCFISFLWMTLFSCIHMDYSV